MTTIVPALEEGWDETEQRALVRPEEVEAARAAVLGHLAAGDSRGAERALAAYHPDGQALIVRTTFEQERQRLMEEGMPEPDANVRAARTAESVLDAVATAQAPVVVRAMEDDVLGVMLSACIGEPSSTVAELLGPERLDHVLAQVPDLWTYVIREPVRDAKTGQRITNAATEEPMEREQTVRAPHIERLTLLLSTLLQTDDGRAAAIVRQLPTEVLALPFAEAFYAGEYEVTGIGDATADADATDVAEEAEEGFFGAARGNRGRRQRPSADDMDFSESTLNVLRDRLRAVSPERCRTILRRAWAIRRRLSLVRQDLSAEAEDRVRGGAAAPATREDDQFTPLDLPPEGDPPPEGNGRSSEGGS